jgi:transcriptional regulator with XRE-family HTH domain
MTTLHERLRWLRTRSHLTLKEVGDRAGVAISQLSDIERGRALPSLDTLERIADVYGLTIGEALVNVRIRPEGEVIA